VLSLSDLSENLPNGKVRVRCKSTDLSVAIHRRSRCLVDSALRDLHQKVGISRALIDRDRQLPAVLANDRRHGSVGNLAPRQMLHRTIEQVHSLRSGGKSFCLSIFTAEGRGFKSARIQRRFRPLKPAPVRLDIRSDARVRYRLPHDHFSGTSSLGRDSGALIISRSCAADAAFNRTPGPVAASAGCATRTPAPGWLDTMPAESSGQRLSIRRARMSAVVPGPPLPNTTQSWPKGPSGNNRIGFGFEGFPILRG